MVANQYLQIAESRLDVKLGFCGLEESHLKLVPPLHDAPKPVFVFHTEKVELAGASKSQNGFNKTFS